MKVRDKILEYILRRKTINSALYILVIAIIRELTALGASEEIVNICNKIQENNEEGFLYYLLLFAELIFAKGSILVLCVLLLVLFIFVFLKTKELGILTRNEIEEIDNYYKKQNELLESLHVTAPQKFNN